MTLSAVSWSGTWLTNVTPVLLGGSNSNRVGAGAVRAQAARSSTIERETRNAERGTATRTSLRVPRSDFRVPTSLIASAAGESPDRLRGPGRDAAVWPR